ncbi:MAG: hypothetical protein H5U04_11190 [Firmicutes bacterium]|nr:hypothetical protein [Bacillota bacterium]
MTEGCAGGEEWKELLRAAEEFRLLAPWGWMDDSHVFGVRNPWTGEVGWCVVMGAAGLVRGLAVYRGEQGYGCYTLTVAERVDGADVLAYLDGLLLEFCDREELTELDRRQVKAAGLKPRGRGVWPQFRSYLPWHAPWYLTCEEACYMRLVLGQACVVAAGVREGTALPLKRGSRLLVRQPVRGEGGWVWADAWLEPQLPGPPQEVRPAEEALQRVLSGCGRTGETWEVDVFPLQAMVSEGQERPWFPPVLLVASDGFPPAVAVEVVNPGPGMWQELLGAWVRGVLTAGKLPRLLRVKRDEVAAMLGPAARLLGIPVEKRRKLRRLEQLRCSLERRLAGGSLG